MSKFVDMSVVWHSGHEEPLMVNADNVAYVVGGSISTYIHFAAADEAGNSISVEVSLPFDEVVKALRGR